MLEKRHLVKEKKVKYATTERDILTLCNNHPNIVKLYYTFKDDTYLCIRITNHFSLTNP
jgi:3-phosphoinositide dependent protein kinase-1